MERLRRATSGALDRVSRLAGADARYALRGLSWLSLSQVVTSLAALGLSVAFARLYPPEAYGTYKYILSLAELISAASLTGIPTAIVAAAARNQDGALAQATKLAFLYSCVAGLAMLVAGLYYLTHGNATLGWSLVVLGVVQPASDAVATAFAFVSGKQMFRARTFATVFQTGAYAAAVLAAILTSDDPFVAVAASAVGGLLGYAGVWVVARRRYVKNDVEDPTLHRYSQHLSLMNILGMVASQIDKVLLFHYLGAAEVALYSFAQAPVSQAKQVSKILSGIALPKVTTASLASQRRHAVRRTLAALSLALVLYAGYWLVVPWFYAFLFPSYQAAVGFSRWYALTLLTLPIIIYKQPLLGHQKTKALYAVQTAEPLVKITLMALAVPAFGVAGAVGAAALSEFANVGISAAAFGRVSRVAMAPEPRPTPIDPTEPAAE